MDREWFDNLVLNIMAHFAQIGDGNIVTHLYAVHNDELIGSDGKEDEQKGIDFLQKLYKNENRYVQTSYNTRNGVHELGGVPLRGTYARVGCVYSEDLDIFHAPQPYPSWTLDGETTKWIPPVECPEQVDIFNTEYYYDWKEEIQQWIKVENETV